MKISVTCPCCDEQLWVTVSDRSGDVLRVELTTATETKTERDE